MKRKILIAAVCTALILCGCRSQRDREIGEVRDFIRNNWDNTLEVNTEDTETLFGLPKPYNVPTVHGEKIFRELYYWDTYFTNAGLLIDGRVEQARNNTDDIIYMVNRFGKMLNGSSKGYLNRSQPPYLSMMVADVYRATGDREWLKGAVEALEREYRFWMTERVTPVGLNRYSSSASDEEKLWMANLVRERFREPDFLDGLTHEEVLRVGSHYTAEAESGWDFNPRYEGRCEDFCPVDLNSNLYIYETNFQEFYRELGMEDRIPQWERAAEERRELIGKYLYDADRKLFFDYDFVNGRRSEVVSAAIFSPLYANLATGEQAANVRDAMARLETPYGIRACEKTDDKRSYQWGSVNGWGALHYIAADGLRNYGFTSDAERLEDKYIDLIVRNYKTTGNLWEKYNVEDGSMNALNEYEMPKFLGWTAGVFVHFTDARK